MRTFTVQLGRRSDQRVATIGLDEVYGYPDCMRGIHVLEVIDEASGSVTQRWRAASGRSL